MGASHLHTTLTFALTLAFAYTLTFAYTSPSASPLACATLLPIPALSSDLLLT